MVAKCTSSIWIAANLFNTARAEGADELCYGLRQAFQKRALPRALMSDNGSAMLAAETTEGLARLSILHETTLPNAPFQNDLVAISVLAELSFQLFSGEAMLSRKSRELYTATNGTVGSWQGCERLEPCERLLGRSSSEDRPG